MAAITFEQAFQKRKEENPNWGTYINMCSVLQESGISKTEITKIFNKYMTKDDYDPHEKAELIDYLVQIANEID